MINGGNSNKNGKIHYAKMSCRFKSCLPPQKTETLAQRKSSGPPSQRLRVRVLYVSKGVHSSTVKNAAISRQRLQVRVLLYSQYNNGDSNLTEKVFPARNKCGFESRLSPH